MTEWLNDPITWVDAGVCLAFLIGWALISELG